MKYMCDLCDHVALYSEMADHFYERHYTVGRDWVLNITALRPDNADKIDQVLRNMARVMPDLLRKVAQQ